MKKYLIIGVALLLLAATAAGFVLAPPYLARQAAERLAGRLADELGRDVQLGDVHFSLFSPLVLDDVSVAGADGGVPLLSVERVAVTVDPWSLLSERPRVRRVDITRPRFLVPLGADGMPALDGLLERLAARRGGEATGGGRREPGPRLPEVTVSGLSVVLEGPGVAAYARLLPELGDASARIEVLARELTVRNTSLLAEDPLLELRGQLEVRPGDRQFGVELRYPLRTRELEVRVEGTEPVVRAVGERRLSVGAVVYRAGEGLTFERVVLTRSGEGEAAPLFRVAAVRLGFDGVGAARPADDPAGSDPLQALAARVGRVDLDEPEVFLARISEARAPIQELEEHLSVDELDARLDEALGDEEPAPAPPARSGPAKKRQLRPNGERLRSFLSAFFGSLEGDYRGFSAFVHGFGSRLPVREVHVRKGRFLATEAGAGDTGIAKRLYNFYLDAERHEPGPVFAFKLHFETPGTGRSKNRIEGKVHLATHDLQLRVAIARLELERYRPLLPASLRVTPDSVLRDTDLELMVSGDGGSSRLEGRVFLDGLVLEHPGIASAPLEGLDVGAELALAFDFAGHRLTLEPSRLFLNGVGVSAEGEVSEWDVAARISLKLDLPRTDAMRLVRAVPPALVPQLEGVEMVGSFGAGLRVDLDTADLETLRYEISPQSVGVHVTSLGEHVDLESVQGRFVHRVVERDGSVTSFRTGGRGTEWTPLEHISRYVIAAVTTTEDGSFFWHDGFSPTQIRRSIIANLERGAFYRGASTISQQLVKNLFLSREKTISRKLQEAFITWQMEQRLSKERILELYLNVIEWGPGLYGIRRAAEHYFGKTPAELTLLDTAFLVSIIPNPRRFYSQFQRGTVSKRWRARLGRIVSAMAARGKVSQAEARAAAPYSPVFRGQRARRAPKDEPPADGPGGERSAAGGGAEDDIPLPGGH